MASANQSSLCFLTLTVAFFFCFVTCSGSTSGYGENRNLPGRWCVANPYVGEDKHQEAIRFCCSQPGIDCGVINPGGSCFNPNNVANHASVVLNLYYKASGSRQESCHINNYGTIIFQDPSSGSCRYP